MKRIWLRGVLVNRSGYAFVTALLAMLVMTAIGVLVFTLTSKNLFTAAKLKFEKDASNNAEYVIHQLGDNIKLQVTNTGSGKGLAPTDINDNSANKLGEYTPDKSRPQSASHTANIPGQQIGGSGGGSMSTTPLPYTITGINSPSGIRVMINIGIGEGFSSKDFDG